MSRALALATATTMLVSSSVGCLSTAHQIPKGELMALSQQAPEERARHVRVVQEFATADSPPPAQRVESNTQVVLFVGVDGGHHHHHPGPRPGPVTGGGGRPGGGGGLGGHGGKAASKSDEAYIWIIIAAAAAIGLAATEGARYDGWVALHPMHPVHLYGPGGYAVVPLAQIDPETAAWAERAVVRPQEGPWTELGRAPLNRAGLTYSMLMGASEIGSDLDKDQALGFTSHIQLGFYPVHQIGVQLDAGLMWRDNSMGYTIYDSRWSLELDFMPLEAGPISGGIFGSLGLGARWEDGPGEDVDGTVLAGGAMLQLGITTRLALTGRFAIGRAYDETSSDATIGLSIY